MPGVVGDERAIDEYAEAAQQMDLDLGCLRPVVRRASRMVVYKLCRWYAPRGGQNGTSRRPWTMATRRGYASVPMSAAPEHATDLARAQFGAVAETYVTSAYHASGPDLQALVKAARPLATENVLDLGCGAGHTALAIAPHVAHVTAVDVTPDMLNAAARLAEQRGVANVTFQVAD